MIQIHSHHFKYCVISEKATIVRCPPTTYICSYSKMLEDACEQRASDDISASHTTTQIPAHRWFSLKVMTEKVTQKMFKWGQERSVSCNVLSGEHQLKQDDFPELLTQNVAWKRVLWSRNLKYCSVLSTTHFANIATLPVNTGRSKYSQWWEASSHGESSHILWQIDRSHPCDVWTEGGRESMDLCNPFTPRRGSNRAKCRPVFSPRGGVRNHGGSHFLFPAFSNHICHSRGAAGARRGCILSGDGRCWSTERIPLGIRVCDMGLTVISSAVTPPHERCSCVAAGGI